MQRMLSPSTATVSARAIRANIRRMHELCEVPIMAVVKADGFGLGAVRVARAALDGGATELGVATCAEAIALRDSGVREPILAWLLHDGAPLQEALDRGIRLSLTSGDQLAAVVRIAAARGVLAEIEFELETGMHRSGCAEEDWAPLFAAAAEAERSGRLRVIGVWTHLAGTEAEEYGEPLDALDRGLAAARSAGLDPRTHAASSVPAVVDARTRRDIVRLGASLFGIEPRPEAPIGLLPVLRWESSIAQLRSVRAGDMVGYGRDRVVRDTVIGLIPIGYADGLPRRASASLTVSVAGRRVPLLGAVSMDQSVVDLGGLPVAIGDRVVLVGDAADDEPGLVDWARALGTIPQEVLTGIGPRVARVEEVAA